MSVSSTRSEFQPIRYDDLVCSKDIEPFNVEVAKFTMRQDVIDDIVDQHYKENKPLEGCAGMCLRENACCPQMHGLPGFYMERLAT